MKKFMRIFSLLLVMTSVVVFQACKDDEPAPAAPPTLTAPTSITAVQINTATDVTFTFKADGGFKSASASAVGGTATVKTNGTTGATSGSVVVTFTADGTQGAGAVTLTLTDNNNSTATAVATLNKTISAPPTVVLSATTGAANPGQAVSVTATITAPNGIKELVYTTTGDLTGSPASPVTVSGTTQELTFTVPATAEIGSTLTATIYVTDNQNLNSAAVVYTVTASANILTGNLTADMTLSKGNTYLIKSQFVVMPGVKLTVEAGTIVKGDKATKGVLVVKPTGQLIANGTAESPIVFTSGQPAGERDKGDWGGIILMGDAFVNQSTKPSVEGLTPPSGQNDFFQYGTVSSGQSDATVGINDQNSGSLTYVRIEYAGIELIPNSETNGLTLAGVGSGTTIDYVQSSYGGDDAFEWFGGTVSAKHLIAMATWDDDFDTDFGWRGNVQFGLGIRAPYIADQSGSTSFESDSQGNGNAIGTICDNTTRTGCTQGVFSNMTIFGPRDFNSGTNANGATRGVSGNYTRAMHIRRRTAISIFNSFISGYGGASGPAMQGLQMDDQGTVDNYTAGVGGFGNNVLLFPDASASVYGSNISPAPTSTIQGFWETGNSVGSSSSVVKPVVGALWSPVPGTPTGSINPYTQYGISADLFYGGKTTATYPEHPSFAVTTGDLTGQSNLFTSSKLNNEFFEQVDYKGAFGSTDWTSGWSNFQPLNLAY